MAETYNKKEREKKKTQKKQLKQMRRQDRKDNPTSGDLDSMMAYVDEFGNITDTPPDPNAKQKVLASNIEIGVPRRDDEAFDSTLKGIINYYDESKGYGFIKTADENSYFMHLNHVSGVPAKGKRATFEKEKSAKGWIAVKVVIQ